MPYPKNPIAHYKSIGGINIKSSKYSTQNSQVLDLRNLDFFIPNAWSKTPGSTKAIDAGTSGAVRSVVEFERLTGESYIVISTDTQVLQKIGSAGFTPVSSGYNNNQPFDFVPFVNKLWMANGQTFLNWTGQTLVQQGLPCAPSPFIGATGAGTGTSGFLGIVSTGSGESLIALSVFYAYVGGDGVMGPVNANYGTTYFNQAGTGTTGAWNSVYTTTTAPFALRVNGITCPSGRNITAIAMFLWIGQGATPVGVNLVQAPPLATSPANFRFWSYFSTGITTCYVDWQGGGAPLGWSTATYSDAVNHPINTFGGQLFCFGDTFAPRYIEINQNSMWMSGFSAAPSELWFSEPGAPDQIDSEANFEVRTNDSDRITGMRSFQNQLMVFKQRSFHKVIGSDSDSYELVQLSVEYGCLSNKAIAEYNNQLLFLDEKGIVNYNGANWEIISTPIEGIFRRMNVTAAIEMASAVHYQERNQVWFGIPIDGASYNNITVVYDYLLQAWTIIEGFSPAAFGLMKGTLTKRTNWYGDYSGGLYYMSPSFYSYHGTAFTCKIETAFDAPDGEDVTSMFRRLFLDVNTPTGVTGVIDVQAFSDYNQSTVQATFAVYQNQFQTRADFGVMAKSIGFKMQHANASLPLVINGYDIQRRFLRRV